MYIVQIASELAPIAKVGGLGDVMMGLSRELKWKGHRVEIFLPKYDCLDMHDGVRPKLLRKGVRSYFNGEWHENSIWGASLNDEIDIRFIEPHESHHFFERGCIYGCHDDIDRFLYFSRAMLDWLYVQESTPDVIHIHDWQTAAISFLAREKNLEEVDFYKRFEKTRIVSTIHNIEYQGKCSVKDLDKIGVTGESYNTPQRLKDPSGQCLNLLKGSIVFSDFTVTVSPTYAKEVLTPDGGKGLDPVLRQYTHKFYGILNGLDYSYWNPEIDTYIWSHYSAKIQPTSPDDQCVYDSKILNKWQLLESLGMEKSAHKPLVASVTRLVPQKGIALLKQALVYCEENDAQFILLGSAPDPAIQEEFIHLQKKYVNHPNVRIFLKHEEPFAHRLYAASDMFIVPSIFEPCGLTQLIALKYGSIPIVRRTGGLADTVFDIETSGKPEANGFTFDPPTEEGITSALNRAIKMWKEDHARFRALSQKGMIQDFSWNRPADQYIRIYNQQPILVKN